jgi:hypothetical protein
LEEKKVLTADEVKKKILEGRGDFSNLIINGSSMFSEETIENTLVFNGTIIKGELNFVKTIVRGSLYFREATVEDNIGFLETFITGILDFSRAVIKDSMFFRETTALGGIDLSTKNGPTKIYVSEEMAQLIHFSAPTIPLVIKKKKLKFREKLKLRG